MGFMAAYWFETKNMLEIWSGLDRDALHIYAALLIQLTTAAVLRKSVRNIIPWLIVLALTVLNEASDFRLNTLSGDPYDVRVQVAVHDLWNSMLLPTLLLMVARFWPRLLTGSTVRRS